MNFPVYIDWAFTRACNLQCLHCVGMQQTELGHEPAVRIAQDIIKLKPKWVILEGGEPLLRRDFAEIGGMLHRDGITAFVITNGNAFTEARLKALASFSPRVLFSFDGADASSYEYVKRGAKFTTALKWARRCADLGIFHGITTVLSRLTLPRVRDFIKLTKELGGRSIIFLPLKPFGEGGSNTYYEANALTPAEQAMAAREIYASADGLDVFYDEPFVWNLAARDGYSLSQGDSGITIPEVTGCAATCSIYIQSDGSVRPCMFCPPQLTFGNAAEESLVNIWQEMQNNPILKGWASQSARQGRCADCSKFASCRGCLARTTILLGDPLASDPCCPFGSS